MLDLGPLVCVLGRRLLLRNPRPHLGGLGIDADEVELVLGYFLLGANGLHRTLHDAQHAVDASLRVDRKEIRSFDETIDRAYRHAIGIFAFDARFSDDVGHFYSMRPAATVLLVASSITMKLPAVRFL